MDTSCCVILCKGTEEQMECDHTTALIRVSSQFQALWRSNDWQPFFLVFGFRRQQQWVRLWVRCWREHLLQQLWLRGFWCHRWDQEKESSPWPSAWGAVVQRPRAGWSVLYNLYYFIKRSHFYWMLLLPKALMSSALHEWTREQLIFGLSKSAPSARTSALLWQIKVVLSFFTPRHFLMFFSHCKLKAEILN